MSFCIGSIAVDQVGSVVGSMASISGLQMSITEMGCKVEEGSTEERNWESTEEGMRGGNIGFARAYIVRVSRGNLA